MKINIVIYLFLLSTNFSMYGQTTSTWLKDSTLLKSKAKKLTDYYNKSTSGKETSRYQKLFFNEFPKNFTELTALFGFEDKEGKANILYSKPEYITDLFNTLTSIPEKEYFTKLIQVSIGGKYQADAISAFQHGVREHFTEKPDMGFCTLQNFTQKEIDNFWKYYFDSPHPEEQAPEEFEEMKVKFPKIYSSMLKGLKFQLTNWKDE